MLGNNGCPSESRSEWLAVKKVVSRLPDGLGTVVGEDGRQLSAGERQRVAVARALLADPAVLVLDEATSALDAEAQAHVVGAYREVMRGRTTLLITHREEMLCGVDRVVGVGEGKGGLKRRG